MKNCSSCGNPAIMQIGGGKVYLCVDCYQKLEQARHSQFADSAALLNFLSAQMDSITGLPGIYPRIQIPNPVVQRGPVTFNNIDIDNSVVGSINTAQVKQLDATVGNIRIGGNEELANQLKKFTEAVLKVEELNAELRDELIEGLSFISSQFELQRNMRKSSIVKLMLQRIGEIVDTVKSLAPLWMPLLGEIQEYFQL